MPTLRAALLSLAAACGSDPPANPAPTQAAPALPDRAAALGLDYRNVCGSPEKRFILEVNGAGVAFLDADGDGRLDLLFGQGTTLEALRAGEGANLVLFRNVGGRFEDRTREAGIALRGFWNGLAVADYDDDGDADVYATAFGRNALLRNEGGVFREVGAVAGVDDAGWGTSAVWFDVDGDGALDLYVVNYLEFDLADPPRGAVSRGGAPPVPCRWKGREVMCGPNGLRPSPDRLYRNLDRARFEDATVASGASAVEPAYGLGAVAADLDGDGFADLYVANDSMANFLFWNEGGRLVEAGFAAGAAFDEQGLAQAGMGVAAGDVDGDALLDLLVTNFSDETTTLYRNLGDRLFEVASWTAGLGPPTLRYLSWGCEFLDFDFDGDLDLFVANGHVYPEADEPDTGTSYAQRNQLFENAPDPAARGASFREFRDAPGSALEAVRGSRGTAQGDFDEDGDLDLCVVEVDGPATFLENRFPRAGKRIRLLLVGSRSPRSAHGAVVRVSAGGRTIARTVSPNASFQSSSDPRLLFGLGAAEVAERVEVRWPSGRVETHEGLRAERDYLLVEGAAPIERGRLP